MLRVSDLRRRPRETAVLASVVVSVVLLARTAVPYSVDLLARTAVPYSVDLLSASAPRLLSLARFWLTPPYLFVTVHLIIITIWKLSDQKSHRPEDDKLPSPQILRKPSPEILRKPSPEIPPLFGIDPVNSGLFTPPPLSVGSISEPSSLTTASPRLEIKKSENLTPTSIKIQRQEADDEDDDSMEARWKAIMAGGAAPVVRRSDTLERAAPPAAVAVGPGSVNEDLDQRFDEFIKKNYEQILVNDAN